MALALRLLKAPVWGEGAGKSVEPPCMPWGLMVPLGLQVPLYSSLESWGLSPLRLEFPLTTQTRVLEVGVKEEE